MYIYMLSYVHIYILCTLRCPKNQLCKTISLKLIVSHSYIVQPTTKFLL